ncbi:MAG: hypothetical protein ACJ72Z_09210 [Pyrinomonadaceae bacterium]
MELFTDLGDRIDAAWRAVDYDEEKFPGIAADFLRDEGLPTKVTPWDILEWGLKQTEFPRQKDANANFGDPPITLYTAPKFFIDIYFWFEGTTAVHQHSFCGAFQVLHGSSIHSWYKFETLETINLFVKLGEMSLKVCELLETGAVQEIWGGRQYIHSLFHLDSPSATICIRTDKSPLELPQFSYHKPNLAIDPFYDEETIKKKLQIISAMARAKRQNMDECVNELLANSDFQNTFQILQMARRVVNANQIDYLFGVGSGKASFDSYLETARKRHGEKIDALQAVFGHIDRLNEILHRRSFITDPEHRFFFALLLNVEGKERILSLVQQRFPDAEPREKVLDWVFDLSQTRVVGANQKNALGIDPFDDIDLAIFEHLLEGRSNDEALKAIQGEYPPEKLSDLGVRVSKVRDAIIFDPLFR